MNRPKEIVARRDVEREVWILCISSPLNPPRDPESENVVDVPEDEEQ